MSENKQTVLTDEEINSISTENETKGDDWYDALSRFKPADLMQFARAIESAVLSKLRAAGEPSDDELLKWAGEEQFFLFCDEDDFLQIARAMLQRYGRPAGDAQPVRWLVTGQCGHDEYTRDAGEAHRVKEQRDKSYCGEDETRVVPIYAAPVAAQKADDALRAIKKIFDKPVTFVGDGPNSTVVVPFESHTQAWNHWHEAREIIDAAIAQQRQGEGGQ